MQVIASPESAIDQNNSVQDESLPDFTSEIYANCGIKVMPGSLMGQNYNGYNPASGYVRLAIVHNHKYIEDAVKRLANFMKTRIRKYLFSK